MLTFLTQFIIIACFPKLLRDHRIFKDLTKEHTPVLKVQILKVTIATGNASPHTSTAYRTSPACCDTILCPWRHLDDMHGLWTLPDPQLQGGGRVSEKGEHSRTKTYKLVLIY